MNELLNNNIVLACCRTFWGKLRPSRPKITSPTVKHDGGGCWLCSWDWESIRDQGIHGKLQIPIYWCVKKNKCSFLLDSRRNISEQQWPKIKFKSKKKLQKMVSVSYLHSILILWNQRMTHSRKSGIKSSNRDLLKLQQRISTHQHTMRPGYYTWFKTFLFVLHFFVVARSHQIWFNIFFSRTACSLFSKISAINQCLLFQCLHKTDNEYSNIEDSWMDECRRGRKVHLAGMLQFSFWS